MAKKKKEKLETVRDEALENVLDYFALSKALFAGDDCPYEINELKDGSPFVKTAKEIAEELEIDWKKMSHEESNRIMLALLDEYYNRIRTDSDYTFGLVVALKKSKEDK